MTIAIDTSALAAVIFGEPDAAHFASLMVAHAGDCVIGAATVVEAGMVAQARHGDAGAQDLQLLIERIAAEVVPIDAELAHVALSAWRRFGKGRHPAALNFGDCFSYAVAKASGVPLLYKGEDFSQTDIPRVF